MANVIRCPDSPVRLFFLLLAAARDWLVRYTLSSPRERDRQTDSDRERETETDRQTDRQAGGQADRERERQRQTDRQAGRQAGRQAERETETETDRQTDRQRHRDRESSTWVHEYVAESNQAFLLHRWHSTYISQAMGDRSPTTLFFPRQAFSQLECRCKSNDDPLTLSAGAVWSSVKRESHITVWATDRRNPVVWDSAVISTNQNSFDDSLTF